MGTASNLAAAFRPAGRAISHAGIAGALSVLAVGVVLGATYTWSDLMDLRPSNWRLRPLTAWLGLATVTLATFAGAWWVARRKHPIRPTFFIAGLVVATMLVRALLISSVDPVWSTDYLRYWQRALELATSDGISVTNIYLQRALFIPYPVASLFGPEATSALKWANALLLLIVQIIVYDTLRLSANHQAAQAASIILLASPLVAYAALIPSHDIWAIFFLAVALWAFVRLCFLREDSRVRHLAYVGGLVALCASATYVLELQRSMGTVLSLTLVLVSVIRLLATDRVACHSSSGMILSAALAVLLLQIPLGTAGRHMGVEHIPSAREAATLPMKIAAHGSAMGTARSAWFARFNDRFRAQATRSPSEISDFSRSVVLSTWTLQPQGKLDAMREHAERLFSLSYPMDWDTTLRRPAGMSPSVRNALIVHSGMFGVLLLSATFLSIGAYWLRPLELPLPALIGAILVLALSLPLLLVFENKPYNISPVWIVYPLILGSLLARRKSVQPDQHIGAGRRACLGLAGVAVVLAGATGGWLLTRGMYGADDGQILDGWTFDLQSQYLPPQDWWQTLQASGPGAFEPKHYIHDTRGFVLRDAGEDSERIGKRASALYFPLRLPSGPVSIGDRLVASRQTCSDGTRRDLEFFMFAPYLRRDVEEAFTVEVAVDGTVVERAPIPHRSRKDSMRLVSVPVFSGDDKQCRSLSLSLVSNVDRSALSWAAASHVEIWFPRLVR